ncbi:C-type mannose receptor 2-like [Xyrauchen texanus]|uniref:C-type mannose receptor 2-like n=1 Tax=Xyrauchen texanus TaxID=154827 RepID=UPI0022425B49|nr:C-type mannose receptor 2-like [Xyrauchen texanus]
MEHKMFALLIFIGFPISPIYQQPTFEYQFVPELKTFYDAQKYCRENHTDLVTIGNMNDLNKLQAQVTSSLPTTAWIGLKKSGVLLWHWALSDKQFYKEGEIEYRNWAPLQSLPIVIVEQNCAVMNDRGYFRDISCLDKFKFICYDGNNIQQQYVFINELRTWRDAQSYCRLYHTELVSVRNQEENLQIQHLIPKGTLVYIGLFQDPYVWSDNSNSSFRNWASQQPDATRECVAMQITENKQWGDQDCRNLRPFFCYSKLMQKQILRVQVKSALNVNDPAMKAAVLAEIQHKLGLANDTKLVWRVHGDGEVFQKNNSTTVV